MSAVATGALSGVPMPLAGTLASLSLVQVANGAGGGDLGVNCRNLLRESMQQTLEAALNYKSGQKVAVKWTVMTPQLYIASNWPGRHEVTIWAWSFDPLWAAGRACTVDIRYGRSPLIHQTGICLLLGNGVRGLYRLDRK